LHSVIHERYTGGIGPCIEESNLLTPGAGAGPYQRGKIAPGRDHREGWGYAHGYGY
jgi:hypothetical protein